MNYKDFGRIHGWPGEYWIRKAHKEEYESSEIYEYQLELLLKMQETTYMKIEGMPKVVNYSLGINRALLWYAKLLESLD